VISLLALIPARTLPDYIPGDTSSDGEPRRLAVEQPSP
jgi:hypothetical protein